MKDMNWTLAEEAIYRPYDLVKGIFEERNLTINLDNAKLLVKEWQEADNMELITAFELCFDYLLKLKIASNETQDEAYKFLGYVIDIRKNDFRYMYINSSNILEKGTKQYSCYDLDIVEEELEFLAKYWINNANQYGNNQDEDNKLDIAKKAFLACQRVLNNHNTRKRYKEKQQELIKAGIMTEED